MTARTLRRSALLLAPLLAAGVLSTGAAASVTHQAAPRSVLPPVRHVFVINLENKGYDTTFGPGSKAPYLTKTLRPQGNLLTQYYGTAHNSLPNYIAQISGQGPDSLTQGDCQTYADFVGTAPAVAPGQAVGNGCVYPASVPTLPDQLLAKGLRWKGYLEDMGNSPAQPATCRHPALNTPDTTQTARVGDQYAARHNPFVYFHSIVDSPSCAANDVPLTNLTGDLAKTSTTANVSFITPNLCDDGHDSPCVDGRPGGLVSADAWLATWVPKIEASPAFQADGLLVVTFDEADSPQSDATACCGEGPGPNSPAPGIVGMGGGRVGAVLVSRYIKANSLNDTPYNHYGLLASIEDLFGLGHLGYAGTVPYRFARDVYTAY